MAHKKICVSSSTRISTPFEGVDYVIRQRRIEIRRNTHLAFEKPKFLFRGSRTQRRELGHGPAGLRDDDLLTGGDLVDDSRQVRLRLMDIYDLSHDEKFLIELN